jgi:vacuolar-type H+-ATPase catalytic subunit A/Vma1
VPDVIGKIEASDAARSISELSNVLTEAKGLIESNRVIVDSLKVSMIEDRDYHSKTIQDIGYKTEHLVKDLAQQFQLLQLINQVLTQNVATSVTQNTKSITEIKSIITDATTKSTREISTLKSSLGAIHALITLEFKMLAEEKKLHSESNEDRFKKFDTRLNLIRNLLFVILGSLAFILFRNFVGI